MKELFLIAVLSFLFMQCVDPYDFEQNTYVQAIVVDGRFTNELKEHEVRLHYSYRLDTTEAQAVSNAEVYILDDLGEQINFVESVSVRGVYKSALQSGDIGRSYQLFVETSDGISLVSTEILMKAPPEIDSVYAQFHSKVNVQTNAVEDGINFLIDTHSENDQSLYFRYEWEDTYKISPPWPSSYEIATDSTFLRNGYHVEYEVISRVEDISNCYTTNFSNELLIGSAADNSLQRLSEFPVRFVSESDPELRTRYSIMVKQYALSEEVFLYYKELKANNESTGSLFDTQLGTVVGNVRPTGITDQTVVGIFEVSSKSELRRFFDPSEMDRAFERPNYNRICSPNVGVIIVPEDMTIEGVAGNPNLFIHDYLIDEEGATNWLVFPKSCSTCNQYANTETSPPEFWID